jgi:hypothetical protein
MVDKTTRKTLKKPVLRTNKIVDISTIKYKSQKANDLAIGLVYFNSSNSKRILMNYLYTVEKLKTAGFPYFTLEVYKDNYDIADAFHIKTDCILFQKERLCRILERKIPDLYTKLLFMDCDVVFENTNWYNELSDKLNEFNIVHPFSEVCQLDITFKNIMYHKSSISLSQKYGFEQGLSIYQPGLAWAFQRPWFKKYGGFEYGVLGGGDYYSVGAWLKLLPVDSENLPNVLRPAYTKYYEQMRLNNPTVSNINGRAYSLWHGTQKKRQHQSRYHILKYVNDIRNIININKDGIFVIQDALIMRRISKFFKDRDDDGVQ